MSTQEKTSNYVPLRRYGFVTEILVDHALTDTEISATQKTLMHAAKQTVASGYQVHAVECIGEITQPPVPIPGEVPLFTEGEISAT